MLLGVASGMQHIVSKGFVHTVRDRRNYAAVGLTANCLTAVIFILLLAAENVAGTAVGSQVENIVLYEQVLSYFDTIFSVLFDRDPF